MLLQNCGDAKKNCYIKSKGKVRNWKRKSDIMRTYYGAVAGSL